jgi:hypothetical protein
MDRAISGLVLALGLTGAAFATGVQAQSRRPANPVMQVGTCVRTTVSLVTQRLEDGRSRRVIPLSGSAIRFANGLYQVSYEQVRPLNESRRGDPVFVCLMIVPRNCPPGDRRGKIYTATNLRTQESWTLPDSSHSCGGA